MRSLELRRRVDRFLHQVGAEEQPYRLVSRMVRNARTRKGGPEHHLPEDMFTTHNLHSILTAALGLRLDLVLLSRAVDWKLTGKNNAAMSTHSNRAFTVDFSANRNECLELIKFSTASHQPRSETEGHILFAKYTALENSVLNSLLNSGRSQDLQEQYLMTQSRLCMDAMAHLENARELCSEYPGFPKGLEKEIDATARALQGSFYETFTNDELHEVLRAMRSEITGTGHWYYCASGHPFVVGECGGPMQTSTCPQCGASIGGANHVSAEGVRSAVDLDTTFARLSLG